MPDRSEAVFVRLKATSALPTTIQHWQLRDLVSCGGEEDCVFLAFQSKTYECHVPTERLTVIQDLAFKPTCMTVAHGYIAAGGQSSQLDVRHLRSGQCVFKGSTGGTVTNALHIGRGPAGDLRLLVSSNNTTIRVFSLPRMEHLATVQCPVAVNYAALSPDGLALACVGDAPHTYFFTASATGYEPAATLTGFGDAGMGCAWNPASTCLAAGSQDGRLVVWDRRLRKAVAHLRAGQACRCVKFSPSGPADFLAFTEHTARCHLVDARAYHASQVLEAADAGECPQLSGLAFSPSSRRLYLGMEASGIACYDVDMLARTTFSAGSYA